MAAAGRDRVPTLLLAAVILAAVAAGGAVLLTAWAHLGPSPPEAAVAVPTASRSPAAEGWAPWDRNEDGRAVRWDPCSPIDLVLDPRGASPGFRSELEAALEEVRELSGLPVRLTREVDERPSAGRAVYQPERYGDRWAPVLVAFARPGERDLPLLDVDHAVAAPVAVGRDGDRAYVTGQVVLNVERGDERTGAEQPGWAATLRHELGHLLGLDHVEDEDQLMHPHPRRDARSWGDGDRRGLAALGDGGCVDVPEPRPLEVELGPHR